MDDLTKIKGIGTVTAKRLVDAGIASFAALAAAAPDQFAAIDKLGGSPTEWSEWAAQAKSMAPAPVDLGTASPEGAERQLTAEEVGVLVKSWDDARAELQAAGDAVAALQVKLDDPDTVGLDVAPLEIEMGAARERVVAAKASIEALLPLPEGARLPDATMGAAPGDISRLDLASSSSSSPEVTPSAPALEQSNSQNTTPSEAADVGGDGTSEAVSTGQLNAKEDQETDEGDDEIDLAADFGRAMASLNSHLDRLAEQSVDEALAFIASQRARFKMITANIVMLDQELVRREREVVRTETVWPLVTIRQDGVDQPIGEPLKVDPTTFLALTKAGHAADHPPETEETIGT